MGWPAREQGRGKKDECAYVKNKVSERVLVEEEEEE